MNHPSPDLPLIATEVFAKYAFLLRVAGFRQEEQCSIGNKVAFSLAS